MGIKAYVVSGYGFNSDAELAHAFELSGAEARRIHVSDLVERPQIIHEAGILAFPGGFSFGDHLGSGKEIANLMRKYVKDELERFVQAGKPVIGICNGFQVLAKLGIVPNSAGTWAPEASLIHNEGGTFMDDWVGVEAQEGCACVWTRGIGSLELPVRHGEGRFVAQDEACLDRLEARGLVALRYSGRNPNGSSRNIAGICDPTGLVLGLMPHPECFLWPEHHPRWRRERVERTGLDIIKAGVRFAESPR